MKAIHFFRDSSCVMAVLPQNDDYWISPVVEAQRGKKKLQMNNAVCREGSFVAQNPLQRYWVEVPMDFTDFRGDYTIAVQYKMNNPYADGLPPIHIRTPLLMQMIPAASAIDATTTLMALYLQTSVLGKKEIYFSRLIGKNLGQICFSSDEIYDCRNLLVISSGRGKIQFFLNGKLLDWTGSSSVFSVLPGVRNLTINTDCNISKRFVPEEPEISFAAVWQRELLPTEVAALYMLVASDHAR